MDAVSGDQSPSTHQLVWTPQRGPLLVFHSWYNVPIVPHALYNLYKWVFEVFPEPIGKWVCFLEPTEQEAVICECYALPNSDVHVIPAHYYDIYACQLISLYVQQFTYPGTIILIAKNGDYTPLWQHRFNGWKIVVIHPPPGICYTLEKLCHYYVQMPVSWGQVKNDVNSHLDDQIKIPLSNNSSDEYFSSMDIVCPRRRFRQFYELDSAKSEAAGDTGSLPLEDFLQRILPSSIGESNVLGIIEDMQEILNKPVKDFRETGGWPTLGKSEEIEEEEEKGDWIPVTKTLADVCKAAATKPSPPPAKKRLDILQESPLFTREFIQKAGKQKAVKYAQQCPLMGGKDHSAQKCSYWHPRKSCEYYPSCYLGAEACGYSHPYCRQTGLCACEPKKRDPQKNHRLTL